jgi:hypothetical protein
MDLRSKLLQTSKDQSFLRKDSLIAFRHPHRTDTAPLKDTSTPPLLTLSPQTHPAPALPYKFLRAPLCTLAVNVELFHMFSYHIHAGFSGFIWLF